MAKTKNHKLEKIHEYSKKENGKNDTGRPTKYSKEILKKAWEYIAQCKDNTGLEKKVNLPKAEGLALYLKVSSDTLYEWAKVHKEFSDILSAVNLEQVERLINNGLSGFYNSNIAKLILSKHGYSDKVEVGGNVGYFQEQENKYK